MLDPGEKTERATVDVSAVFIVDDHKKLRATILYPATTGRNFARFYGGGLVTVDGRVSRGTPAGGRGEKVCVAPSTPDEVAQVVLGTFQSAVPSGKKYLRLSKIRGIKRQVLKRGMVETI